MDERPRIYRLPGGPVHPIPAPAVIAKALLRGPVTLTRGEADELADTVHSLLTRP